MGKQVAYVTGMSAAEKAFHLFMDFCTLGLWYVFVHGPRKRYLARRTYTVS